MILKLLKASQTNRQTNIQTQKSWRADGGTDKAFQTLKDKALWRYERSGGRREKCEKPFIHSIFVWQICCLDNFPCVEICHVAISKLKWSIFWRLLRHSHAICECWWRHLVPVVQHQLQLSTWFQLYPPQFRISLSLFWSCHWFT